MESTRILGTGSYLPPTVLTNYDLEKKGLDTTHDWIVKRTGVSERRIADDGVTTSDLGYEAGLKALKMAGMSAREIDLIIVTTITPDTCGLLAGPLNLGGVFKTLLSRLVFGEFQFCGYSIDKAGNFFNFQPVAGGE